MRHQNLSSQKVEKWLIKQKMIVKFHSYAIKQSIIQTFYNFCNNFCFFCISFQSVLSLESFLLRTHYNPKFHQNSKGFDSMLVYLLWDTFLVTPPPPTHTHTHTHTKKRFFIIYPACNNWKAKNNQCNTSWKRLTHISQINSAPVDQTQSLV